MKQHHAHIESVRREQIDLTKLAHAALRLAREQAERASGTALSDQSGDRAANGSPKPRRTRPRGRT